MKSVRHGDTEISFETNLDDFLGTARDLGVTQVYPSVESKVHNWTADKLTAQVIIDWQTIEKLIKAWFEKNEPEDAKPIGLRSVANMVDQLLGMGVIDPNLHRLLQSFRQLRNKAAHGSETEITTLEMVETVSSAESIRQRLQNALKSKPRL